MSSLGVATGNQPPNGGKNDYASNDPKALLNTYIHNYLVHEGHFDLAKSIRSSQNMALNRQKLKIETGNNRQQINGADDSMDSDSKDDLNNRLDGSNKLGDTFLLDYWFIFWDMWQASKRPDRQGETGNASAGQYWDHQKAKKPQLSNQQQQQMLQQGLMSNGFGGFQRPGMMPQNQQQFNMQKAAIANNPRVMGGAQFPSNLRMQHFAQQQQMPMEGADVDMNGPHRPPSPMSGPDSAPSPKRQRIEGGPFNNAPNMQGRNPMNPQQMNGAPGNPKQFSPDQITQMMDSAKYRSYSQGVASSAKVAMNNNMPNGVPAGMHQMSPEIAHDSPGANNMENMLPNNPAAKGATNGGALADYQMQLMLLEQQNKKRLMVARQENQHDPPSFVGNHAFGPQNMSPHGSKTGHSPPGSDRQRGTPRMGPGSPLPDVSGPPNRASPGPTPFNDLNPMGMNQPYMAHNGNMMRPVGANPQGNPTHLLAPQGMELGQRGGMPNAAWASLQGRMPGQGQPQPPNPDNGQARGNMPPPSAPSAASKPSPTQQPAATPNNSQNNPKNSKKKETKETKKKNPKKPQPTTGATPSNDTERATTPTPPTPHTPVAHESHLIKGPNPANSQNGQQLQQQQGQPQQAQQQAQQQQPQPPQQQQGPNNGNNQNNMPPPQESGGIGMAQGPFGNLGSMENEMFNLDYGVDTNDVLEAFDFDTFLDANAISGDFPDFTLPDAGGVEGAFDEEGQQRSTKVG